MRKNILLILTDQQTYTTLGCYGNGFVKTPNLDKLAAEGTVFDNAYTVCPICTPARASLQTGVYPNKHGMATNIYTKGCIVHELPDNEALLSRRLLHAGYSAGYTGKWHLGAGCDERRLRGTEYPFVANEQKHSGLPKDVGYEGESFPGHGGIGEGYDEFKEYLRKKNIEFKINIVNKGYPNVGEITSGYEGTVPHYLVDCAEEKIAEFASREKPFFYMLNFWQPHEPYHVPTEFLDIYRNSKIEKWASYDADSSAEPAIHDVQRGISHHWEVLEEYLKYYYASITHIDYEIGRLFDFLKEKNLYDDTIIMFSADHGETLGVHNGLLDKGLNMFEETVHIPLIVKGYGVGRNKAFVNTCDLYSTVLDIAGVPRELCELEGKSVLRLLNGETDKLRDCVVSESSGIDNICYSQRMIRKDNYKFVFHPAETDELYDLEKDGFELVNLAKDPAFSEKCIEFLRELEKWMTENKDGLIIRYRELMWAKINRYKKSAT